MCVKYEEVLSRFVEYRKKQAVSQKELAQMLGVTQGYVSKMEIGRSKIPCDALVTLYNQNWDIDYIITGEESSKTELDELLEQCRPQRRAALLQHIVWTVMQGIRYHIKQDKQTARYAVKLEHLRLRAIGLAAEENDSALYGIRSAERLSQQKMAEILDVDVKKYRAMEKEQKKPDAELLTLMYNRFGCIPSEVIAQGKHTGEINQIWRNLSPQFRGQLLEQIKQGYEFING